ncbi:MAG: UPF0280 family protein [Spirochaetia bacterium]
MAEWRSFSYRNADYRIFASDPGMVIREIKRLRNEIEKYGNNHPDFFRSFKPLPVDESAAEIIQQMYRAAIHAGVGPMAAVAGAIAEWSTRTLLKNKPDEDVIVDNGGDLFIQSSRTVMIGLYPGLRFPCGLGLELDGKGKPFAVCSSSGRMGHSVSLGKSDLVTVIGKEGAAADAAATAIGNHIQTAEEISDVLEIFISIPGISGIIAVKDDKLGMIGDLPELVRMDKNHIRSKVTRNIYADFQ